MKKILKYSFTYYLTIQVLKLKGIKNLFKQDPVPYLKVRKEDVYTPKKKQFKGFEVSKIKIIDSEITQIKPKKNSKELLLFVHGGAFISGPAQHHWDSICEILKQTNYNGWMCNYPKAPENKISKISQNIDEIYENALKEYSAKQITLIGDSVGATLIIALIQRLEQKGKTTPKQLILVTPVMDASMSNTEIIKYDKLDPMLSKRGILSSKKMCAENNDLNDEKISPINGSFNGFPKTLLFTAEHDIMYPDQILAIDKMKNSTLEFKVINGEGMPHIWPFLPVMKESRIALKQIIDFLKN